MSKELSSEAIQGILFERIVRRIEHEKGNPGTEEEKLYSLAFGILAMLDGVAGYVKDGVPHSIPNFIVAPNPDLSDKAFHMGQGMDYYPENDASQIRGSIS